MSASLCRGLQGLALLAAAVMAVMLVRAVVGTGDGGQALAVPWGQAMLADVLLALAALGAWIAWREPTWPRRLAWLAAIALTGSFAVAIYIFWALRRLDPGAGLAQLVAGRHLSAGQER